MGVWRDLYCLRSAALGAEGRGERAEPTRIVCHRVGWYAWGTLAVSGGLSAVCAAGWRNVSAEKHDYLPGVLPDCGDLGVAGSDPAMADSQSWAFNPGWHQR